MNIIEQIQQAFADFITKTYSVDHDSVGTFTLNTDEQKRQFGHMSANTAMILAKKLGQPPRQIAQEISQSFAHHQVEKIELAGPGFLNFHIMHDTFKHLAQELYLLNDLFFKLNDNVPRKSFNLEFVSANPTGPLHLGHGRGGIIGDVLGNVLHFIGHQVTREFYINDAGSQIEKLGRSLKIRCEQALGHDVIMPEESYHGEYLIDLAAQCIKEHGKETILEQSDLFFQAYAKEHLLERIKRTLQSYGIQFDVWFSEKTLHVDGQIEQCLEYLDSKGYLYESEGALWFRSTQFGDDKDRVLKKSDGHKTYVAADIAYMKNKIERGADQLIMILGHDHHSYVTRLQGLLKALNLGPQTLDVILYQLVKMKASGQLVKMSKRAGNIVTLEDVIEVVGTDVARFFYLNKKADAQLEFDIDLALKKNEENPVFYVQYAYVRTGSILRKAAEITELDGIDHNDAAHITQNEQLLLAKIVSLKGMLESISNHYQTHMLTYYVLELAQTFHSYYAKNRVIDVEQINQSRGRLLMVTLLRNTFETVLKLLEITRPEKM